MVLYGGTAVALRLGHRQSVDFDFFKAADLPGRDMLIDAMPFVEDAQVVQEKKNSLTILTSVAGSAGATVKVSFFGGVGFGRVGQPGVTSDGVLEIASREDLMSTKLKVILQRVAAKDYQDLAALVRAGVSLPHGLAAAKLMYGRNFQPTESLKALTYFHGGDLQEVSQQDRQTLIQAARDVGDLPDVAIASRDLVA